MSDKTTLKEVASGVETLLQAVAKAHREWASANQTETSLFEFSVSYCTFEILRNTFRIEGIVDEPGRERLDSLISSVRIQLEPLTEAMRVEAQA